MKQYVQGVENYFELLILYQSNQPSVRGKTAEAKTEARRQQKARRTTILQPVEQKPHSQKERQDEKAEGYVPDEGTR